MPVLVNGHRHLGPRNRLDSASDPAHIHCATFVEILAFGTLRANERDFSGRWHFC